jgi:putative IMPACT (imprinted ancient) family translation regulator
VSPRTTTKTTRPTTTKQNLDPRCTYVHAGKNIKSFITRKSLNNCSDAFKNGWFDWNLLSHGGLSTSFSRLLSQNLAGNSSFTFNLEISGMLMKRSIFELNFQQENGIKTNLIEVKSLTFHIINYFN